MKVLIAEDEPDTLQLLSLFFREHGHQVLEARDGLRTLDLWESQAPDLVLLDIRMPRLNGWEVLEKVGRSRTTPVIVISALEQTDDAVHSLMLGADDYLRKPFDIIELEARVDAVLRRARPNLQMLLRFGALEIDDNAKCVRLENQEIRLSPREYHLLRLLASAPGRVFSPRQIIDQVWPVKGRPDPSDVKQYIHLLRLKIEADPTHPRWVQTVKGFGYKFVV